jgi:hypothetical protein
LVNTLTTFCCTLTAAFSHSSMQHIYTRGRHFSHATHATL